MDTQASISVRNLTKRYPPKRAGLRDWRAAFAAWSSAKAETGHLALDNVTFDVRAGEIFGLLGANGAGKTTFCKILNALVIPTAGQVLVRGLDSVKHHQALTHEMVTIFGGESDLFGLFENRLSVEHNLRFIGDLWGLPPALAARRIQEAIELFGLQDKRQEWYQKLSAGTKQKLFLAIPMMLRRPLVILDEPTIRLDVPSRRTIQDAIRNTLNKELGATIVLTTHDMQEAERLCDRIGILKNGRLEIVDTPRGLRARASRGGRLHLRVRGHHAEARIRTALARTGESYHLEAEPAEHMQGEGELRGFFIRARGAFAPVGSVFPVSRIVAELAECGLAPEHLTVEEPSLEDVFVELLERDAAPCEATVA